MVAAAVSRARELHRLTRWDDACVEFLAADAEHALDAGDLELFAEAAQLTGRHHEAASALERAFTLRAAAADLHRGRDGGVLVVPALHVCRRVRARQRVDVPTARPV